MPSFHWRITGPVCAPCCASRARTRPCDRRPPLAPKPASNPSTESRVHFAFALTTLQGEPAAESRLPRFASVKSGRLTGPGLGLDRDRAHLVCFWERPVLLQSQQAAI